jgi:O-antigen/teichoic acid export membrane protein
MDSETKKLKRSQRSPLRKVLHGSVWFGLAILINRILPGILIIILAWWLEPKQLGVISFILAYYSILLPVADWSISYALQKLIPENRSQAKQIYWTAVLLRLGVSVLLGLVCWGLDVTTGAFHGYGLYLAFLLAASVFGTVVYAHNALGNFAKGSLYSIALYVLWIAIALVLVKVGMPISGPLLGLFFSFIALGLYASLVDPAIRGNVVFLPRVAVEIIRFGWWATLAVVLSGFAGQIGVLIVDYVNGDAAAAVFKMAATFAIVPALLGMIVVIPLMPVAREGILNGHDIAASLVLPITRYLLMLGLPITAAGLVLAPEVIATFTRQDYTGAIWPLRILLGANLLRALMTAASGVLFVGQGLRALAKIYGAMVAITLIAGVLLARRWAVNGMAVAQIASWIIGAVLMCFFFQRRSAMRLEWKLYLRYAASAVIMAAVVYFGARVGHTAFERLLLGGCISSTVYFLLLWLQRDSSLLSAAKILRNWATG